MTRLRVTWTIERQTFTETDIYRDRHSDSSQMDRQGERHLQRQVVRGTDIQMAVRGTNIQMDTDGQTFRWQID